MPLHEKRVLFTTERNKTIAMDKYKEMVNELLASPEKLRKKKPFVRGATMEAMPSVNKVYMTSVSDAKIPSIYYKTIPQEQYIRELDPQSHSVLFDENVPSLCVKVRDDDFREIKFSRMAIPFQRIIRDKQVLHLTGNPLQFTLTEINPTEEQNSEFILFKQYWDLRNQDGMKKKMVATQKSYGDAGLLYYFDRKGEIKSRVLSFADGYVLCPHNDDNGDRILESVYYSVDDVEYIDSYDDTYMYRWTNKGETDKIGEDGWILEEPVKHGFNEIPLITKRGNVAWENVQSVIESYEILYNIFNAIQKRYGWGILYIKGNFGNKGKKLAGNIILNDTSLDGNGDAKFLAPPSPEGTIETLNLMEESIQKGASTTFLLPKDIKISGQISGIAIALTQSLDIENALQGVIEWQNVVDKMVRLFKFGLSKELVNKGITKDAYTKFADLKISAKMKVWRPMNDYEYNQMITILTGAGVLSKESGIELNTLSKPDEKIRVSNEEAEKRKREDEVATQKNKQTEQNSSTQPQTDPNNANIII